MGSPMILLVEDDENIRELVRLYLEANQFDVWEAESIQQAFMSLDEKQPDLIVLDILLPDGSGLELCQTLRDSGSEVPVLFLSCKDDSEDMITGLDLGGDDYVTKPFDPNILISRVKAILRRRAVQEKRDSAKTTREELIERLTKREIEMLALIKEGFTNQEIALHYQISIGTVKGYNNQLFGKLGAKNRTHAIMLASEIGILSRS
ncbi:DNA-binding response regulator [Brevibacillus reuszeri]|uniref:DNA-binding response regulator n=1 Tax=Brevibacillus reuszeri TaxID=54915 RepID=A0ABQ0TVA8_9BACL|nr:response regulator transcription factor [Brevibacillus reuszeri]MED1860107.1 response regulator transcription factor [Brevibacillus reuszeri]GED71701.1 DNA-binding response regulator [Brevibacillus reuszeri]